MISEQLQRKIDASIKLLRSIQAAHQSEMIEVAYSGGKDSDVILQLAKEAGINYEAIYKNTTIDPPGTIKHAEEMGVEIIYPKKTFFQLIEENGLPSRFSRHCCRYLKEYKILDKSVIGVRREESRETHPKSKAVSVYFQDEYEQVFRDIFCETNLELDKYRIGLFGPTDYKKFFEDYFDIKL